MYVVLFPLADCYGFAICVVVCKLWCPRASYSLRSLSAHHDNDFSGDAKAELEGKSKRGDDLCNS